MWATFPGVEFLRALSMFIKTEKGKFVVVWEVSRRSRAVDVKGYALKSVMHVQSSCFAYKTNCFLTTILSSSYSFKVLIVLCEANPRIT